MAGKNIPSKRDKKASRSFHSNIRQTSLETKIYQRNKGGHFILIKKKNEPRRHYNHKHKCSKL